MRKVGIVGNDTRRTRLPFPTRRYDHVTSARGPKIASLAAVCYQATVVL